MRKGLNVSKEVTSLKMLLNHCFFFFVEVNREGSRLKILLTFFVIEILTVLSA